MLLFKFLQLYWETLGRFTSEKKYISLIVFLIVRDTGDMEYFFTLSV